MNIGIQMTQQENLYTYITAIISFVNSIINYIRSDLKMSGKKDEIEILRKKLLDRIDELNNRTHRYNRTFNWHYEVKEIINELFGVE